jgi:hypothetical protein
VDQAIARVKAESEQRIIDLGGQICDWLPWLERTNPRAEAEVINRALTMNAMLQIHFGAPAAVVADWLEEHQLSNNLSARERAILDNPEVEIDDQDRSDLFWYIEALWAFAWMGCLIPDLRIENRVGDNLASLLPKLQNNEPPNEFRRRFSLRPFAELYAKLDLYYRAHWYAREGQLRGFDTGKFSADVIVERRKALEWVCDTAVADWDDTPLDT